MKRWQQPNTQSNQNQGYSSNCYKMIKQLQQCQEFLCQNLENVLKVNKQLILNAIYSNYMANLCYQTAPMFVDTRQNVKNVDQQLNQKSFENNHSNNFKNKLRIKKRRESYDTKNIPKNFGTAIHIFIKRNSARIKILLAKKKLSYSQFYEFNKQAKEKINSLLHLRQLWQHKQDDPDKNLKQCYRIISFDFMRKHCLSYIFGSRIKNTASHIRYRKKLLQGIERPHTLFNLKDY